MSPTENGDGTTTISWRTEPQASGGSYPGQDRETGETRIRRDAPNTQVDVLSLKGYLTRSFDLTVPAAMSGRWVPLYLAPPTHLQPGVYWLGLQSDMTNGVARFAWATKPGSRRSNIDGLPPARVTPSAPRRSTTSRCRSSLPATTGAEVCGPPACGR